MPKKTKIEELHPHHETVLGCLRLALSNLDNTSITDKEKISRAKHNIRDGLKRLGFTEEYVDNPPSTLRL